jgi:hypothetical protein
VQLRARDERAVLVGYEGEVEHEVDPRRLPLGGELTDALHEWARVAGAVARGGHDANPAASAVVRRRGLQLAERVAASMGVPVGYLDPLSGEERTVEPPPVPARAARPPRPPEATPWLTGLTVSVVVLAIVLVTVVTLAATLAGTHALLAVASNVVVTVGLLPSLWLVRRQPVWRWVAYGVAAAIVLAWLVLPFVLL